MASVGEPPRPGNGERLPRLKWGYYCWIENYLCYTYVCIRKTGRYLLFEGRIITSQPSQQQEAFGRPRLLESLRLNRRTFQQRTKKTLQKRKWSPNMSQTFADNSHSCTHRSVRLLLPPFLNSWNCIRNSPFQRRHLFLLPLNECSVEKFVCTTVRPIQLPLKVGYQVDVI